MVTLCRKPGVLARCAVIKSELGLHNFTVPNNQFLSILHVIARRSESVQTCLPVRRRGHLDLNERSASSIAQKSSKIHLSFVGIEGDTPYVHLVVFLFVQDLVVYFGKTTAIFFDAPNRRSEGGRLTHERKVNAVCSVVPPVIDCKRVHEALERVNRVFAPLFSLQQRSWDRLAERGTARGELPDPDVTADVDVPLAVGLNRQPPVVHVGKRQHLFGSRCCSPWI
mmetsp:Transcript_37893/g.74537  ORF Transcript_37893/g.74537 Transcript_37893/m.74537 type:complete len:225 (-) Transcript_37893:498-1172(-)